jgi:hypothetical protein
MFYVKGSTICLYNQFFYDIDLINFRNHPFFIIRCLILADYLNIYLASIQSFSKAQYSDQASYFDRMQMIDDHN